MEIYDYFVKIIIIGESGVGKTSLMNVYFGDPFDKNYTNTIGVDFRIKTLIIENKKIRIQFWDTAGHEKFRSIVPSYFRGANIILLVFDLTNRNSFEKLEKWMADIHKHLPEKKYNLILVGNKCDKISDFQIKKSEIEDFTSKYNIDYVEVSAKASRNIENAFNSAIYDTIKSEIIEECSRYHSDLYIIPGHENKSNQKCCYH